METAVEEGQTLYKFTDKGQEWLNVRRGDLLIRQATVGDEKQIVECYGIQQLILNCMVHQRRKNPRMDFKRQKGLIRGKFREMLSHYSKEQEDNFDKTYVILKDGRFIGYFDITSYADVKTSQELIKKVGHGYGQEVTFAGVEIYYLTPELEATYKEEVEEFLVYMCEKFGFYDHLDVIETAPVNFEFANEPNTKYVYVEVIRNLYDYESNA